MRHILFVCLGNICRSPLAEGILRARVARDAPELALGIDSAGLGPWHVGNPPDPRAVAVAAARGIDIAGQRARQISTADFDRFDLVLCADRDTLSRARGIAPRIHHDRIERILDFAGQGGDVPDPYRGSEQDFENVFDRIDAACAAMLPTLQALARSNTALGRSRTQAQ